MSTPFDPTLKLGVMAKYWTPGAVKTRLGAAIGMESAAALHRLFCLHLAKTLHNVADEQVFVVTPRRMKRRSPRRSILGWWSDNRKVTWAHGCEIGFRRRRRGRNSES